MQPDRTTSPPSEPKSTIYPAWIFVILGVAVLLHLNYWLWGADRLVSGLPINLFYHVLFTLALSGVMWVIVRNGWPSFLEDEDPE